MNRSGKRDDSGKPSLWTEERLETILKICRSYYEQELTYEEIEKETGISKPSISRLIREATEAKVVRITVVAPLEIRQAEQLEDSLKVDGIIRVIVAGRHGTVGEAAARHFERHGRPGATIVLDGGLTVEAFVDQLSDEAFDGLTIVPICADPPSYKVSAYELMTRLAVKIPNARCEKLPHFKKPLLKPIHDRIIEKAQQADFVFLGSGPWKRGCTASEFVQYLGFDPETMRSDNPRIACLCGYCAMDANGEPIALPDELEEMLPRALGFADLRRMAGEPQRTVALLVAGEEKSETVRCVLRARICNTLIIDSKIATALIAGR